MEGECGPNSRKNKIHWMSHCPSVFMNITKEITQSARSLLSLWPLCSFFLIANWSLFFLQLKTFVLLFHFICNRPWNNWKWQVVSFCSAFCSSSWINPTVSGMLRFNRTHLEASNYLTIVLSPIHIESDRLLVRHKWHFQGWCDWVTRQLLLILQLEGF